MRYRESSAKFYAGIGFLIPVIPFGITMSKLAGVKGGVETVLAGLFFVLALICLIVGLTYVIDGSKILKKHNLVMKNIKEKGLFDEYQTVLNDDDVKAFPGLGIYVYPEKVYVFCDGFFYFKLQDIKSVYSANIIDGNYSLNRKVLSICTLKDEKCSSNLVHRFKANAEFDEALSLLKGMIPEQTPNFEE